MIVNNTNKYILKCWHKIVSDGADFIEIQEIPFDKRILTINNLMKEINIDGVFASYSEGIFCLYKNDKATLMVSWNGQAFPLNMVDSVRWFSNFWGRHFTLFSSNGDALLSFSYQTLKRFKTKPLNFIMEFFAPDDDWGLVADLPSYVHSGITHKNLEFYFDKIIDERPGG